MKLINQQHFSLFRQEKKDFIFFKSQSTKYLNQINNSKYSSKVNQNCNFINLWPKAHLKKYFQKNLNVYFAT